MCSSFWAFTWLSPSLPMREVPLTSSILHVGFQCTGQAERPRPAGCCSRSIGWFSCAHFRPGSFYPEASRKCNQRCSQHPSCMGFVSAEILNSACWALVGGRKLGLEGSGMRHQQSHTSIFLFFFKLILTQTELKGTSSCVLNPFPSSGAGLICLFLNKGYQM